MNLTSPVTLRRRILCALVAGAASLLSLAGCGQPKPAPQVTFVSLKGERVAPADLVGKVTIVKFWATDCVPCLKEMPDMVRTYNRYRDRGLEYIAVAMQHDPPNYVIRYTEDNRLPFKVALDPTRELANAYGGVKVTPTTFVVDKRGNIVSHTRGTASVAKLNALLEEKLKEP